MTKVEVVTHDLLTGRTEVDHAWDIKPEDDPNAILTEAEEWAEWAAKADRSTDHVVYVRGV